MSEVVTITIENHTGMSVEHYLKIMRKNLTIKNLAIKMGHSDTGQIYRRLKQVEPDFEFMVNIMEAFNSPTLIEYVPEYVKLMLKHHAKIKHPEWFTKENTQITSGTNESNTTMNVTLKQEMEYRENVLLLMRELLSTQKELIEIFKAKQITP